MAMTTESKKFHKLLTEEWRYSMEQFPEAATAVGYPGLDDRWTDFSESAIENRKQHTRELIKRVKKIRPQMLGPEDRLNYALFLRQAELGVESLAYPDELQPITQIGGGILELSQTIDIMPTNKKSQYENILLRMEKIPLFLSQIEQLMRRGLEQKITPPRITLRDIPDQIRAHIVSDAKRSPLLKAFSKFPSQLSDPERSLLLNRAIQTYDKQVRPSFISFLNFIEKNYIPNSRQSISWRELPNGQSWYALKVKESTTTELPPQKIHDIGLTEVKRIRKLMEKEMAGSGFKGSFSEFGKFLLTDERFFFTDPALLVTGYRDIAKRADPELSRLFGKLPRQPYGVSAVPPYAEKSQTTAYYQHGSLASGRPGTFFANTYNLRARPKWAMEVLTLHEAVPGHHLQISLAEELDNLPEFRRHGGYTAFVEGWALYCEKLGYDMGFYADSYSRFGQLDYEMWRAIRLVVDTGIHDLGWSREQGLEYFRQNMVHPEHDIVVEVDRYIVWPAQALAYKIGELKIMELRSYAEKKLGDKFDIRHFHDALLSEGALPIEILEKRMKDWIDAQVKKSGG
ncbi:MAG: DUF885 domain-containing protein [Deltaproteobacteria bacterium]|nr:DUF885 domain-containing protein [Deltaproteobacteria bacterium]